MQGARNPLALSPTSTRDEVANRRNELLGVRHLDPVRRVRKDDQLGAPDVAVHLPGDRGREERILSGGDNQRWPIDRRELRNRERRPVEQRVSELLRRVYRWLVAIRLRD
jgi:hypothetical protein